MATHQSLVHIEDSGKAAYTPEGSRAGETGNIIIGSGPLRDERWVVDQWMTAPFHGIGMIQPSSTRFGFGSAQVGESWGSTLTLLWDRWPGRSSEEKRALIDSAVKAVIAVHPELAKKGFSARAIGSTVVVTIARRSFTVVDGVVTEGAAAAGGPALVVWPGPGSSVALTSFSGPETPDPLTSCRRYRSPSGIPIYISRGVRTEVRAVSFADGQGRKLPVCVVSAGNYTNPNKAQQALGRSVLKGYGAVVLLPKSPLTVGQTYRVALTTTDGQRLAWSFLAGTDNRAASGSISVTKAKSKPKRK